MNKAMPGLDAKIAKGELGAYFHLGSTKRCIEHGHVCPAQELMQNICNKTPDEMALVEYLECQIWRAVRVLEYVRLP